MYIVYKSLDDFTKMVVFILSRTLFGNIYKFVNGFRILRYRILINTIINMKNIF